jgi:hypothetical protein
MTDLKIIATSAQANTMGFDCNSVVRAADARRFAMNGYKFALRYIPRELPKINDLTATELQLLVGAGLGMMPVQHVEKDGPPWWTPTIDKGRRYGQTAVDYCRSIGVPNGVTVWLDLEGVVPRTNPEDIIRYCNYWFDRVKAGGYEPGIYVGYGAGLTPAQLYQRLKFSRYWAAFNLNGDQYPAVRGVCMRQHAGSPPAGVPFPIDVDGVTGDHLGGLPTLAAPFTTLPG